MAGGRLPLRTFFPKATQEQLQALVSGLPVPPSPDWNPETPIKVSDEPVEIEIERSPLVSAIMIFGEPARATLAQRCINRFLLQTYENKELVIINCSGKKLTNTSHPAVRELMQHDMMLLGEMRNKGLSEARGKWVTMWDDDDLPSYHYIEFMMHRRVDGRGLALRRQIRTSVVNMNLFLYEDAGGVPSTLFFQPRPELQYLEADLNDTTMFYQENFSGRAVVIQNNLYPTTCLHIAVHHGHNVTPVEEFMGDLAAPSHHRRCFLPPIEAEHLKHVLGGVGIKMNTQDDSAQNRTSRETV